MLWFEGKKRKKTKKTKKGKKENEKTNKNLFVNKKEYKMKMIMKKKDFMVLYKQI